MDPMPVVMQRAMRDDCHENVKLLINKISELNQENEMKKHLSCGNRADFIHAAFQFDHCRIHEIICAICG